MPHTYIIEHPTRGVLKEIDHDYDGTEIHKFAWSGQRGDPDTCMLFTNLQEAQKVYRRLPSKLKTACKIRYSAIGWKVIYP